LAGYRCVRDVILDALDRYASRGVSSYAIEWPGYVGNGCFCQHTRAVFAHETGRELTPEWARANRDEFDRWKQQHIGVILKRLVDEVHDQVPDVEIWHHTACTASHGRGHAPEQLREAGIKATMPYMMHSRSHDLSDSYYSVRRFVARLNKKSALPFRRLETLPGEEAQVDFGTGAPVRTPQGKTRRPWIFRIVLSHSRKAYSEAVWRQSSESFIQCLENAFRHFGGVPGRLVIDNLKAVVAKADWYDPEVHPKLQSFAAHYGTVFLPTKPYTPRHKGKVENSVKYVKGNALKGRVFTSLAEENEFLLDWETHIADTRIHGTTKRQVKQLFEEQEREALLPLPKDRFPFFHEGRRTVHRDGHIEVDKAYYSAPPEYLGRRIWVRWDGRLVRLFNDRWESLGLHAKQPRRTSASAARLAGGLGIAVPATRCDFSRPPRW
jgi:transposase